MPKTLARLILDTHSYVPGQRIVCRLIVPQEIPIERITNVSLDLFRIEQLRNQFAFGFGAAPRIEEGVLEVESNLPTEFCCGLYAIGSAILTVAPSIDDSEFPGEHITVTFVRCIFQVRTAPEKELSHEAIAECANAILRDRAARATKPFIVATSTNASQQQRFLVFVFGVGCLIHQHQQLEGFSIIPIGRGLSHANMSDIVNQFLQSKGLEPLPFIAQTEHDFSRSTPTFVLCYPTVIASSHNEAFQFCAQHSERVFDILGIARGQKPSAFAHVAVQHDTPNLRWHSFHFPGYRGNMLSDFNPVQPANEIEQLMPRLEANAFSRLLLSTYGDATAEHDYGFALLRFCSVLELIADNKIPKGKPLMHPSGAPILNPKGHSEKTDSNHGKVYAYILANNVFEQSGSYIDAGVQRHYHIGDAKNPNINPATELYSLWDMVRATYAIRNFIAHEGQFDLARAQAGKQFEQLAARLRMRGGPDPLRFIQKQAQIAIRREV